MTVDQKTVLIAMLRETANMLDKTDVSTKEGVKAAIRQLTVALLMLKLER